ncbi:hypothetical protein DNK06_19725 [Pseudomonas daroniae]|uniref:PD(D/E)XK endonuclease domain-containing protein n=1 Tax=Phytopseudomonas daroniae TaxID=2487519 RepID=A0A4Q9QH45_9GAMM|nr:MULTISPECIES: hypothetical protein [Pseudomonas]TBU73902.1 hypothetical protein DNK06_19725 [Pseudomonas daroniae]TBU74911.1 hypothetical protein DNK31_23620 [Pseudomonas sp. FRB 228]TBU88760.1 hypothetical protein DNJ99_18625 [Pseudomonas daroniae]
MSLLNTHQSVYREKLIEHLFIGEMLKLSWLKHGATLEVSHSLIDRSGHDIVLEVSGVVRHIQLKTSALSATTANQKVHLALGLKPSGCVIWIQFDEATLTLGPFLFFGGLAGKPLASLEAFKTARHTKANMEGIKAERPHIRVVPRASFTRIESIEALYDTLFDALQVRN